MVAASVAGLLVGGLYVDGPWAREALRGGDLVTLVLVAPILVWSLMAMARGSHRATAVWLGALAYAVYNYAYYVFGADFNDIFVLHIALFALSIWAAALAVASLDIPPIAAAIGTTRATRWVGGFLVVTGAILGGLWITLALRYAVTGELMADIPRDGVHLVFAIDLSLLVPALVLSGVCLWRGLPTGVVFSTAMAVMGGLYQINLLVAGVFQSNADVAGVKALPIEGVVLAAGFIASAAALLIGGRGSADRPGSRTRRVARPLAPATSGATLETTKEGG
jgi:hypothetical protein